MRRSAPPRTRRDAEALDGQLTFVIDEEAPPRDALPALARLLLALVERDRTASDTTERGGE